MSACMNFGCSARRCTMNERAALLSLRRGAELEPFWGVAAAALAAPTAVVVALALALALGRDTLALRRRTSSRPKLYSSTSNALSAAMRFRSATGASQPSELTFARLFVFKPSGHQP